MELNIDLDGCSREQLLAEMVRVLLTATKDHPAVNEKTYEGEDGLISFHELAESVLNDTPPLDHSAYEPITMGAMLGWATKNGGPIFKRQLEATPGVVQASLASGALLMMHHMCMQFGIEFDEGDKEKQVHVPRWFKDQLDALSNR